MSKTKVFVVVLLAAAVTLLGSCASTYSKKCGSKADKCGWRLGMQTYSFRAYTLYEAIDKSASLGLKYIESYPGQKLSPDKPDVRFGHRMPVELRQGVKDKLAHAGIKNICYGVTGFRNDERQCRQVFDFAKDMGIEIITAEPNGLAFDIIEKLCKEYDIKVAIHNHPKPSRYWSPDKVLAHIKGRDKRIGVCADTGHWMRSGLDPVECLKKLEGRIISLHFKDLNGSNDPKAHDVVWGTGTGNVKAQLRELKRQGGNYVFSIEYEHNWTNSMPDIRECIDWYKKAVKDL